MGKRKLSDGERLLLSDIAKAMKGTSLEHRDMKAELEPRNKELRAELEALWRTQCQE